MNVTKEVKLVHTNRQAATPMASHRKISLTAGLLYLLTLVSIPTLILYGQVQDPKYILGAGPDTAVIAWRSLWRSSWLSPASAPPSCCSRCSRDRTKGLRWASSAPEFWKPALIFLGVAFLLSIVSLRQAGAGANALVTGQTLAILYDRIFLLGQSFMPAVNDLLLGFLLYKSRLVPRALSLIGIVGGPVLVAGYLAVLFGLIGQDAPLRALAALPVFLFEFSLGVWLIVKGFNPSASERAFWARNRYGIWRSRRTINSPGTPTRSHCIFDGSKS